MADFVAKRFWKETTVAEVEDGFTVHLDGRSVRTPAKAPLVVPSRGLAEKICAEWDAQEGKIDPEVMPYTRGANAAIDKVSVQHAEVADMLAAYGDSDLLCYRADSPRELVALQNKTWDPVLQWIENHCGAKLETRTGIMHVSQSQDATETLRARVHAFSNFELSAFHDLVALSGSLCLALAVTEGRYSPEDVWQMSRVDEDYQISQWGEDEEASEMIGIKKNNFLQAADFFRLAKL